MGMLVPAVRNIATPPAGPRSGRTFPNGEYARVFPSGKFDPRFSGFRKSHIQASKGIKLLFFVLTFTSNAALAHGATNNPERNIEARDKTQAVFQERFASLRGSPHRWTSRSQ